MFSKNKRSFSFVACLLSGIFLGTFSACKKDDPAPTAITVTSADISAQIKPGGNATFNDLDNALVTFPTEGANQTWNYLNAKATGTTPFTNNYLPVATNTNFGTATYTTDRPASLGAVSFTSRKNFYEISATGWYDLGGYITAQTLNLPNNIVLRAEGTEESFVAKDLIFKLPLTFGDTYTNNNSYIIENYRLTVPAFGLNQAPVTRKLTRTRTATVSGWGKLRLPGATADIDVLQVKLAEGSTENYTLNGGPAPVALLNALGLTEGSTTATNSYVFISKTNQIVAEIAYKNVNNANTVTYGDYKVLP